jgi:hypothetical protein
MPDGQQSVAASSIVDSCYRLLWDLSLKHFVASVHYWGSPLYPTKSSPFSAFQFCVRTPWKGDMKETVIHGNRPNK